MLRRWTERSAHCRVRYSQDSKRVVFSSDYAQAGAPSHIKLIDGFAANESVLYG